jgi:hypothetical protein
MTKIFVLCIALVTLWCATRTATAATFKGVLASQDVAVNTNPSSAFWRGAGHVYLKRDTMGKSAGDLRTKVLSRWTKNNLYLLFICPYQELNLKPNPNPHEETNELWNWDVAEAFIGSNFQDINRYKEFEVSPNGKWVDLDINLNQKDKPHDWKWNSGFQVAARIDRAKKIWYGAMRIPFSSIDPQPPKSGTQLRINLFRSQGPQHKEVVWQPTMSDTFHVPSQFGVLKLVDHR